MEQLNGAYTQANGSIDPSAIPIQVPRFSSPSVNTDGTPIRKSGVIRNRQRTRANNTDGSQIYQARRSVFTPYSTDRTRRSGYKRSNGAAGDIFNFQQVPATPASEYARPSSYHGWLDPINETLHYPPFIEFPVGNTPAEQQSSCTTPLGGQSEPMAIAMKQKNSEGEPKIAVSNFLLCSNPPF